MLTASLLLSFLPGLRDVQAAVDSGGGTYTQNIWLPGPKISLNVIPAGASELTYIGEYFPTDSNYEDFYQFRRNIVTNNAPASYVYIRVSKSDPLRGELGTAPLLGGLAWKPFILTDPNNVAPPPIKKIKVGRIWGSAYFLDNYSATNKDVITGLGDRGEVDLVFEDHYGATTKIATRTFDKDATGYFYNAFTIGKKNVISPMPDFLWEGTYRLIYQHDERSDCATGEATGESVVDKVLGCTIQYSSIVNFKLKVDSNDVPYVYFLKNDGPHESAFNNGDTARELTALTRDDGIDMDISIVAEGAFEKAIKSALYFIGNGISSGMQMITTWINQSINESADIDGLVLRNAAKNVRDIALSVLTLGLIIIAFANILNLQMDRFAISKILPKFVIGIVLAYFSYFIAMFLLSFMGALQALMIRLMGINNLNDLVGINALLNIDPKDASQNILSTMLNNGAAAFQVIILLVLIIILFLVFIWLWLVMVVRKAMLMLLVVVAPLAFIASILPWTEQYYKKWWATFWKWAFIGPAVIFMLLLAKIFLEAWAGQTIINVASGIKNSNPGDPASADTWIYLAIYGVLIFMAASIPLKMGSEIYGAINKHLDKVPGVREGKAFVAQRKAAIEKRGSMRGQKLWAGVAQVPGLRRLAAGVDQKGADAARESLKGAYKENFVKLTKEKLNTTLNDGGYKGIEAEAAYDYLASTGQLDMDKANVAKYVAERAAADGGFLNTVKDKQVDSFAKITTLANEGKLTLSEKARNGARAEADKSIAGKAGFELKPAQIEHLAKNNPAYLNQLLGDKNYIKGVMEKGGPGAKAAWGEAVKLSSPASNDRELQSWYTELASIATSTEERAREQAAKSPEEGGKNDRTKGKNAWGEANSQRPNPYDQTPGPGTGYNGMGPGAGI